MHYVAHALWRARHRCGAWSARLECPLGAEIVTLEDRAIEIAVHATYTFDAVSLAWDKGSGAFAERCLIRADALASDARALGRPVRRRALTRGRHDEGPAPFPLTRRRGRWHLHARSDRPLRAGHRPSEAARWLGLRAGSTARHVERHPSLPGLAGPPLAGRLGRTGRVEERVAQNRDALSRSQDTRQGTKERARRRTPGAPYKRTTK